MGACKTHNIMLLVFVPGARERCGTFEFFQAVHLTARDAQLRAAAASRALFIERSVATSDHRLGSVCVQFRDKRPGFNSVANPDVHGGHRPGHCRGHNALVVSYEPPQDGDRLRQRFRTTSSTWTVAALCAEAPAQTSSSRATAKAVRHGFEVLRSCRAVFARARTGMGMGMVYWLVLRRLNGRSGVVLD